MIISRDYGTERWRLPPPIDGGWADLDREDARLLVGRLAEARASASTEAALGVEAVRLARLDFYAGWMLCDIQTAPPKGPPADENLSGAASIPLRHPVVRSYLYGPDGFTPLEGLSTPIHEHNALHGIDLSTAAKFKSYLRFFCFFVRGELGPFELHETDRALDIASITDREKQAGIASSLRPLEESGRTKGRGRKFRGCVLYGENLFESDFQVTPQGKVEMLNDELLAVDVRRLPPLGFDGNARFAAGGPVDKEQNVT